MEDVSIINLDVKSDSRGSLVPIESLNSIPFPIERVFFINNLNNKPRGHHAHKRSKEIVIPIIGSFDLILNDGITTKKITLKDQSKGILIPPDVWLVMENFSKDCILLAICSHKYDTDEYISNYEDFLEYVRNKKSSKETPFFSLTEQVKQVKREVMSELNELFDNCEFVLGPQLESFENNFARYNNSKYCVGVSNGTSAIISSLKALNINNDDEVIIQSNTYIAGALALEYCNINYKIVDVDKDLTLDLDKLEEAITDKTKAVIVVHLYGACCDMIRLLEIKNKYNLLLIEDCAQAHGSSFNGKSLGTYGDIGCFSFYPSKNLGSFGEGGCIITDNEKYYEYIRRYRNYGSIEKYKFEIKGVNDRLHNIQAAILDIKLKYLDEWNSKKSDIANLYNSELNKIDEIMIPHNHNLLSRAYHLYVVRVKDREGLMMYLDKKGVKCGIHYPQTSYKTEAFRELNDYNFDADIYSNEVLSLPMYPELEHDKVLMICRLIKEYYT